MTAGREVVEDYRQVGLTLRNHPVTFLRADLNKRNIATCEVATAERDGKFIKLAGLVRQTTQRDLPTERRGE